MQAAATASITIRNLDDDVTEAFARVGIDTPRSECRKLRKLCMIAGV